MTKIYPSAGQNVDQAENINKGPVTRLENKEYKHKGKDMGYKYIKVKLQNVFSFLNKICESCCNMLYTGWGEMLPFFLESLH